MGFGQAEWKPLKLATLPLSQALAQLRKPLRCNHANARSANATAFNVFIQANSMQI